MTFDFAARSRQFQDALYEALGDSGRLVEVGRAMEQLAELVARCRKVAGDHEHIGEALEALDAIARREDDAGGLSEAAVLFESPQRFRETLFFARCLDQDPASALELMAARSYVAGAVVPVETDAALAAGQAALLDETTFAALRREPERFRRMIEAIDVWRRGYIPVYQREHAAYNDALSRIAREADADQPVAEAIERLNRLHRLGTPLAENALLRFHEIAALFACPANEEHLEVALQEEPVCFHCGFRLGDEAPVSEAAHVTQALHKALVSHHARLSQRVVPRLSVRAGRRSGDNLDRFIEIVQAGDLASLSQVLDEALLGFLEDLLDTPEPRINLIERLAREHPELTPENLDAVVESFRRIATDEVARGGGRVRIGPDGEPA